MACERKVCGIVTASVTSVFVDKCLGGLSGKQLKYHLTIPAGYIWNGVSPV
jgi:hypothetical protein